MAEGVGVRGGEIGTPRAASAFGTAAPAAAAFASTPISEWISASSTAYQTVPPAVSIGTPKSVAGLVEEGGRAEDLRPALRSARVGLRPVGNLSSWSSNFS